MRERERKTEIKERSTQGRPKGGKKKKKLKVVASSLTIRGKFERSLQASRAEQIVAEEGRLSRCLKGLINLAMPEKNTQTDRQKDRQTDRQTDRQSCMHVSRPWK